MAYVSRRTAWRRLALDHLRQYLITHRCVHGEGFLEELGAEYDEALLHCLRSWAITFETVAFVSPMCAQRVALLGVKTCPVGKYMYSCESEHSARTGHTMIMSFAKRHNLQTLRTRKIDAFTCLRRVWRVDALYRLADTLKVLQGWSVVSAQLS